VSSVTPDRSGPGRATAGVRELEPPWPGTLTPTTGRGPGVAPPAGRSRSGTGDARRRDRRSRRSPRSRSGRGDRRGNVPSPGTTPLWRRRRPGCRVHTHRSRSTGPAAGRHRTGSPRTRRRAPPSSVPLGRSITTRLYPARSPHDRHSISSRTPPSDGPRRPVLAVSSRSALDLRPLFTGKWFC
jgi:hypothetical protein